MSDLHAEAIKAADWVNANHPNIRFTNWTDYWDRTVLGCPEIHGRMTDIYVIAEAKRLGWDGGRE